MEIRVIVNPQAAAGSADAKSGRVMSLLRAAGVSAEIATTTHRGHATELARQAIREGVSLLLVVGGDGSLNEVAQAYLAPDGSPVNGPELGLIPSGTGGDFSRTLQLHDALDQAVARTLQGPSRPVDLGVVDLIGNDEQPVRRAFLNIASFGISGLVARMVNQSGKWMGGRLGFYAATTRASLGYGNVPVCLSADGNEVFRGKIYTVALANGRYFGGGMKIAPKAELEDGLLDCVILGDFGRLEAMFNTPRVYSGDHQQLAKVQTIRGRKFEARPWLTDAAVFVELDGETPGRLPITVQVHPRAIQFRG